MHSYISLLLLIMNESKLREKSTKRRRNCQKWSVFCLGLEWEYVCCKKREKTSNKLRFHCLSPSNNEFYHRIRSSIASQSINSYKIVHIKISNLCFRCFLLASKKWYLKSKGLENTNLMMRMLSNWLFVPLCCDCHLIFIDHFHFSSPVLTMGRTLCLGVSNHNDTVVINVEF